jgi:hypothetical protein
MERWREIFILAATPSECIDLTNARPTIAMVVLQGTRTVFGALDEDRCSEERSRQATLANCGFSEKTQMDVIIQKINDLWHIIVGSCQIRTPFLETQDREWVVAYARRIYPGAKVFERD